MSFDLQKILESKRALRRDLAMRPIGEKLRMLDAMRERELVIRGRVRHFFLTPNVRKLRPIAQSRNECRFAE
jgi:hypothetical protein